MRTRVAFGLLGFSILLAGCQNSENTAAFGTQTTGAANRLAPIDRQLATAAARRDAAMLAELFGENGAVDTAYLRTAHANGFKPLEDKIVKALEQKKINLEQGVATIFAARVSVRACTKTHLVEACRIVGTEPQDDLRKLADSL